MYEVLEDSEGELRIIVPESCYDSMDEQMVIKVGIDVKVINPKHVRFLCFITLDYMTFCSLRVAKCWLFKGIHFVSSFGKDDTMEKGAHVYTHRYISLSNIYSNFILLVKLALIQMHAIKFKRIS